MSELFLNLPETKPAPLQSARIALAEAERERDLALYANGHEQYPDDNLTPELDRAVNRYAELVKSLELEQLKAR